jgi:hypothetical protein
LILKALKVWRLIEEWAAAALVVIVLVHRCSCSPSLGHTLTLLLALLANEGISAVSAWRLASGGMLLASWPLDCDASFSQCGSTGQRGEHAASRCVLRAWP